MEWKNIYRGLAMGASDIVPGVSGGTIAVLLGIYDRLIEALNGLFSKDWKRHLSFLIPLGIGIAFSIFTLSKLMNWFLFHHPKPTYFMFLGLILGVLPYLTKEIQVKRNFSLHHYGFLLLTALLIASLDLFLEDVETIITDRSLKIYALFFFSGFLGSAAMILPGVSGSFILILIGVYHSVIYAISYFQFDIIIITGLGIAIGLVAMSKLIHYFLSSYEIMTYAVIIGMILGSTVIIFPGMPGGIKEAYLCLGTFALGLLLAYILGKVEYEP